MKTIDVSARPNKTHFGRIAFPRFLAAGLVAGSLIAGSAWAEPPMPMSGDGAQMPPMAHREFSPERMEQMHAARKRHVEVELHEMANRLQITAAQEPAWQQFSAARLAMMPKPMHRPKGDMNAAEIAQFRAERMKEMADHMAALSAATANLRRALDDNQRKVLDDMAHRFKHRHGQMQGAKSHSTSDPGCMRP